MPEKLYALSEGDVTTLRDLIAAFRAGDLGRPMGQKRPLGSRSNSVFGVVDATVTGTTGAGTDPTSGTLSVYKFTSTGGTSDTGTNETVYNMSLTDVTTDQYAVCERDFQSGNWILTPDSAQDPNKRLCRFLLDATLTTSDATVLGVITNQYGSGIAHSTTSTITLGNLLTSGTSVYLFAGSSGAAGLAAWDSATTWRILQMECT